jgi:hypothetical protein
METMTNGTQNASMTGDQSQPELSGDDLSFVDRMDEILARRDHYAEVLREGFRQKLKHLQNDGEQSIDYARHLIRADADVTEELKELDVFANSLLLVLALMRREIAKKAEAPTQFWQESE